MKTKFLITLVIALIVISIVSAGILARNNKKSGQTQTFEKPKIEKILFIHYKKNFAKPNCNNNGICEPEIGERKNCLDCKTESKKESLCYKFLRGKARWQWKEDYYVSPDVDAEAVKQGVKEWENYGGDIFGSQLVGEKPWNNYDGFNAVVYGDFEDECEKAGKEPCAIAVTGVWISGNKIIEYDIIFDSDFKWGDAATNSEIMDWQNIATHEFGHAAGLNDLYEISCSEETMFGKSEEGEVKKRTLHSGDISGIKKLYRASA